MNRKSSDDHYGDYLYASLHCGEIDREIQGRGEAGALIHAIVKSSSSYGL